jgi:hypothetical protein
MLMSPAVPVGVAASRTGGRGLAERSVETGREVVGAVVWVGMIVRGRFLDARN